MHHFSLDKNDIENWARFSGDWNPIHFNIEAARELGIDNLVVHGMLAALELKQKLHIGYLQRTDVGKYHRLKIYFRNPMLLGDDYKFFSKERNSAFSCRLCSVDEKDTIMTARVKQLGSPEPHQDYKSEGALPVNLDDFKGSYSTFKRSFAHIDRFWIFVESYVFGQFIKHHMSEVFDKLRELTDVSFSNLEEIDGYSVVQTTQEISLIGSTMKDLELQAIDDCLSGRSTIKFQISDYMVSGDEDVFLGEVKILIFLNDKCEMISEIGLLGKKNM